MIAHWIIDVNRLKYHITLQVEIVMLNHIFMLLMMLKDIQMEQLFSGKIQINIIDLYNVWEIIKVFALLFLVQNYFKSFLMDLNL